MVSSASMASAAGEDSESLNLPNVNTVSSPADIDAPAESAREPQDHHARISKLAYSLWCQRGCPDGSPEVDWFRAEQKFRES